MWIQTEQARVGGSACSLTRASRQKSRGDYGRGPQRELPVRLLALAAEHGVTVTKVSVRNQRWRWGSCSRSGHICLNWRLAGNAGLGPRLRAGA